MRYKLLFITVTFFMLTSGTTHADLYNSYGAALDHVVQQSSNGALSQKDSCRDAAQIAQSEAMRYLEGLPTTYADDPAGLQEEIKYAEEDLLLSSPGLVIIKVNAFDPSDFSSPEQLSEQYYQECMEE